MFKKFISYYRPHLKLFIIDMVCAFLAALCDLFYPFIARNIINIYVPDRNLRLLLTWAFILLLIYLFKALMNFIIGYWGHIVGVRIQADLRRDLFNHLETLPISYYDENKTGTIMSRIINDLQEVSELAHHGPEDLFLSIVMIIGSFFMLISINLKLTLIVFAFLPFAVVFTVLIRKKQMDAFSQARIKIAEVNAEVETSIAGIRVTKAYTSDSEELKKFDQANNNYKIARRNAYKYLALFHSGMTFFMDIMYLVVLTAGGIFFYQGMINTGDFAAYLLYISNFLTPIRKLVNLFEQLTEGMTGFKRFEEIMAIEPEKDDPGAIELKDVKGDIDFDKVSFHYGSNKKDVIKDLSFKINPGETLALVGPSGGGKTTICNLIPRFYEIDSGTIYIDGKDIKTLTRRSLRQNIGSVAQDVFLFNGSIKDNIIYGNPEASDDQVEWAAKQAEIHEYIMTLPEGYDTEVGERGLKLSGGQRQRIAIARVFLKNPKILILDEATSALDNATEMAIQKALEKLAIGRTVLVVAHRLSTINNADEIVVLTNEGIKEKGTQQELLAKKGLYWQLYQYQFR